MVLVATEGVEVDVDWIRRVCQTALEAVELGDTELSVLICGDARIQALNAEWRGKDAPTDVLSFPMDDDHVLGDVVVSLDTATRQASERGHDVQTEIAVLLVHGLGHVLGHDHETDDERAAMEALERRILDAVDTSAEGLIRRAR